MFNNFASRAGSYEDSSSFRSSRGAFSADFRFPMDSFGAGRRNEDVPGSPLSSTPNAGNPEVAGYYQEEYIPQKHSYSEQPEGSKNGPSRFRHGTSRGASHTMRENGPFGGGHDEESSSSSSNPYYKPSYFASIQELFNRSKQSRASGEQPPPDKQTPDHGRVPEPIVEEPDSPPASPVQQLRLLGKSDLDG
ncbi:hypothetical protein HRG_005881 [Hirsutella rhossiliensis]|uniref:Uncharacterized protein n=1 Tax=Hirsutella rhossiliensis TaxID=111463 RepID=A0A9P8MZY5_9HYPO|nr:uncharacterized protein HRG_05881 [Hirsutella rhossiliensis]KAH0963371.1 hypothetical protein HRG_05881 [Hirsutella rhossiliensis]